MIKNYLIIALRSLRRNFGFSLINTIGLAVGMAAAILILLWVADEVSFDRFHKNLDEIYRVYEHQAYSGTDDLRVYNTPGPLADKLRDDFPSIKRVARLTPIWRRVVVSIDNVDSHLNNGFFGDQEALDIFTFNFIYGSPVEALTDPNSIILTQASSETLFGNKNPVGQSVTINKNLTYIVKGVIDKPKNTHLYFNFIVPFQGNVERFWQGGGDSWQNNSFFLYVQIDKQVDYKEVEKQIANVVAENGQGNVTLYLEPLRRSYLYNIWGSGSITNVRIFSVVALLVLLIACINFMNLTTARSAQRAKEVGLRKVSGGNRVQLIGQFLGESVLLTLISLLIAVVLAYLFLPAFNDISGKTISIGSFSPIIVFTILLVTFITGVVSGSYPAFFLSSFKPISVLKGKFGGGSKSFRTVLVVFQFTLSVGLIIATMIVNNQLEFMVNKNLGFSKDNIVVVGFNEGGRMKYDILKEELTKLTGVEMVTMASGLPHQIGNSTSGVSWEGKDPNESALFSNIIVYYDFLEVFGMDLIEGRSWDSRLASDTMALIVNEEAVRVMSLENPIGQVINLWGYNVEIIGVVKNFNFQNLKQNIEPLLMFIAMPWQSNVCIRMKPEAIANTMKDIEEVWGRIYPGELFKYSFFDQEFDNMYRSEMRMMKLFSYFSFLATLISCLGLFGLATFMVEQKFKEIAIRKTLGASEVAIVGFMVWEFLKWVLLANILAWLIAYYAMELWLRGYAFRVSIKPDVFLYAGILSVVIAVLTVSYQAFRASRINPVEALKYE